MVTYGGMSRKPVSLATSHLIFKQIQLHGFWMGQWNEREGRSEARMEMYREVGELIAQVSDNLTTLILPVFIPNVQGSLLPPKCQLVSLDDYQEVLDNTLKGFLPAKYVFDFEK